ncbi:MAG: YcnI family protein [Solirubrobacterales bacterium]|nr:YcnI family protein [Solirubrobacterales bacterium]MCB8915313.1 YcnI family protein [Thermoleophilales bacterium]
MNIKTKTIMGLTTLFAILLASLIPAVAGAHVEMSPSQAPAGKPVSLSFEIPHGCDGAATTSIVVQIPKEADDMTASAVEGWNAKTTPETLTWTGGPLPDHQTEDFPFRATLYGKKGETVMFKTVQKCQGGAQTAWIQATPPGGEEPEHPAPAVTLTSAAAVPASENQAAGNQSADSGANETGEPTASAVDSGDSGSDDDGGNGKTLILIVIAGLAIGTVAGLVVRARRKGQGQ